MSSVAGARAMLRRLFRVVLHYDVDRPHLKALFPSSVGQGDVEEGKTSETRFVCGISC
jgi:hypothetical protein